MDIMKKCPLCGFQFSTNDILHDRDIMPLGLRLEDDNLNMNFFYFTHAIPGCGTTFVIPIEAFESCLPEIPPVDILANTAPCEGHCENLDDHGVCSQNCRYAPYRRLLQQMLLERQISGPPQRSRFPA